jgi:hypothetical protein
MCPAVNSAICWADRFLLTIVVIFEGCVGFKTFGGEVWTTDTGIDFIKLHPQLLAEALRVPSTGWRTRHPIAEFTNTTRLHAAR